MTGMAAYEKFVGYCRDMYALETAGAMLSWDQDVMMPVKGLVNRSKQ